MHFPITSITANKFLESRPPRAHAAPGPELISGPLTACWPPKEDHGGRRDRGVYKPSTVNLHCCQPIWTGDTWVKWFEMRSGPPLSQTLLWTLLCTHTHTHTHTHIDTELVSSLLSLVPANNKQRDRTCVSSSLLGASSWLLNKPITREQASSL